MKRDALFKVYFADEARYADLINGLNFSGRQVVRPEDVFLYRFRREDKLYPVITFLLYYGQEEWQGPRTLHDMLDFREIPENMRKLVPDYPVNLVEIRKLTNTEVFRTDIRQVFDFIRCSEDPEQLRQLMENDEVYCALAEDAYDVVTAYTNAEELIEQKEESREGECVRQFKS